MVQLNQVNGGEQYGNAAPVEHLPPRPSSRDGRGIPQNANSPPDKRGFPPVKPRRRESSSASNNIEGTARREPVGGEERGSLPPIRRRTPSPRCRADSPSSVASTWRSDAPPSRRRHRQNGAYHQYPDQYASRDAYDPQSYYYYYQNYQKYWEQHPYYREYYRQCYGRYGYPGATGDDKTSIRSGRSSVNDEIKKSSLSSQFRQDFLEHSSMGAYDPSSIYPEHGSLSCKSYTSGDMSGVPSVIDENLTDSRQRISPLLFTGPHIAANFTPGGKLLLVLPNDPKDGEKATVQVRNVQKMLSIDKDYALRIQKVKAYPGPLTVRETHKDIVLRFCEERATEAKSNEDLFDKESVVLIWEYLSLLVKQNGNVCGADFASLLIKGRTFNTNLNVDGPEEKYQNQEVQDASPQDEGIVINGQQHRGGSNQAELVDKFTEYLCLGRKKEAVDYAIREGLWGYAMILATKMDIATQTKLRSAIIHSIPSTHVLQTGFQHLYGKKPEVTKTYSDDRWGDWQRHLAVMVSNPTGNSQRDAASMLALGDTLAAKNRLHAAHLCYLAAEAEWGTYSNKSSKLVLIGASHHLPFRAFSTDDAIQCTEIYEYAKSLDVNSPLFSTFQSYKFIYALRLTECGFPPDALKYCEVISEAVIKHPHLFKANFVSQVYELALQLKYHDVHYQMCEGEISEMADPEWLQSLQNAVHTLQYQEEAARQLQDPVVKEETLSRSGSNDHISSTGNDYGNITSTADAREQHNEQAAYVTNSYTPDIGISGISRSTSQYDERPNVDGNHTYEGTGTAPSLTNNETVPMAHISTPPNNYGVQQQPQQPSYQAWQPQEITQQPCEPEKQNQPQTWQPDQQNQPQSWQPDQQSLPQPRLPVQQNQPQSWQTDQQNLPQARLPDLQKPPQQWQQDQPDQPQSWQPEHYTEQHWQAGPQSLPAQPQQPQWQNGQEQNTFSEYPSEAFSPKDKVSSPPRGERTAEEEEYWSMMSGKDKSSDAVDSANKAEPPQKKADDDNDKNDEKKSFLGSLFGGWRKGTNQAKLPDDKDPTIVWDDKNKKWVNKDGDENEDTPPPPPPASFSGAPPPNLSSLRGGNKKSRYVDPVGEKNRAKPSVSPKLPTIPQMAPSIGIAPGPYLNTTNPDSSALNYGPSDRSDADGHGLNTGQINPQENQDQMRRKRYVSETSSVDLFDGNDSSQIESSNSPDTVPMMMIGDAQPPPMFFNPSQFRPQQASAPTQPKRTGPSRRTFNPKP